MHEDRRQTGMRTTHHRLVLSACAALVVAACGESAPGHSDASLAPPVVVRVTGSVGLGGGGMASPAAESSTEEGRDMGLLPFAGWVFELGEGLPALPTNSTGYHFPAGAMVDAAEVARIAAALDIAGEPQATDVETGNAWRVGPDDGSAPALYVANDSMGSWYYSGPWDVTLGGGCVGVDLTTDSPDVSGEDDTRPIEECPTPEPPVGVPSAEDAEARSRELLIALGEDPAAFLFETYSDEWGASVTAFQTIDGLRWPIAFGFSFGGEGVLQWANGLLVEPVATGPYPLIDLDAVLARLAEQNTMWGFGVAAVDDATAEEAASSDVQVEPAPGDQAVETPDVEPVVATLVDVRADLWWAWDADNSVWLLPAYTFTDTEGMTFTVPAVTDEYMMVVEPAVAEPLPAEPENPAGEPGDPAADLADLATLVGVPLADFETVAAEHGYATRVARQDGVDLALTEDYSETRVNVAVEGDVVVEVLSLG